MADNSNQIGILFGVEGGSDVNGASGAKIAEQLQAIANKLDGKIKFVASLDKSKTRKAILDQLKDIQSDIKLGLPEIDKKSSDKAINSFRSMSKKLSSAMADLTGFGGASFRNQNGFLLDKDLKSFQGSSKEILDKVKRFQTDYSKVAADMNKLQIGGTFSITKDNFQDANKVYQEFENLKLQAKQLRAINATFKAEKTGDLSHFKVLDSVTKYLQKYGDVMSKNTPGSYQRMIELSEKLKSGIFSGQGGAAQQEFLDIATNARLAGGEVETLGQKVKRVFDEKLGYGVLATLALYARQSIIQVYNNVANLDAAMTELKKVTDETDVTYNKFLDDAAERAQKLGATMSDVVTASADFARLGFGIDDASKLANAAIVYKNVGDGISDISTASESLISTLKAFDIPADDVMKIVDVYNAIGNTEATSSAGIGEALQRSASALSVAGASVEEASALAAAMNTTVQNSEKVGTTLKTASMYLRAAKTDAEDAGESTEGMAESVSQLRDELKSITDVDIMKDDDTFKGIFQQYRELAAVWNSGKLTDVAKANVLNLLGGKRNADAISGMLNNWEVAERALQTAQNSSGSALSENEKYLNSINGKISQLKAQFEDISRQVLSSDTVKWTADLLQNVLKLVDGLAETKTLLPTIFALIATNKGLGVAGTDSLGNITLFGKTKEQRATNKYLGSVVDENTFFGFKSPILDLTSDELKSLKAFNAEIISGTAGQEAFEKHLSKSRDYVKNLGQELEVGAVSMQTIETATTGASTAMAVFNSLKAMALNFVVMAGIELAVAVIKWVIAQIPTVKKFSEDLSKVNDELKSLKSESETLNSELKTTVDRIDELENKDSLTLVEENELAKLRQTNAELKAQIALNEALQKQKTKKQGSNFIDWWEAEDGEARSRKKSKRGVAGKRVTVNAPSEQEWKFNNNSLEEYLNSGFSQLSILRTQYNKAAADGNEKQANKIKSQIDDLEEELQSKYDEISKNASEVEYISSPTTSDEKKINEYLDIYNTFKARMVANSGDISGAWAQITSIPRFSDLVSQLKGLGESGQLSVEKLNELWNSSESFKEFIRLLNEASLIQWKDILGDNFKDLDTSKDGLVSYDEITVYATNHSEDFKNALSGVATQFKEVSSETEEATEKMSDFLEATKSLTDKFTDIESKKSAIADMLAEVRDDGGLSSKSMSSLFNDFSGVEGFENYIKILTSSKSSTKQLQNALNGLYGAYIDNKGILNDVTEETFDYAQAQLKALGVTNSVEVASVALAYSLTKASISKKELNESTIQSIRQQMIERGASEAVGNQYIQAARACIEAQDKMSQAISAGVKSKLQSFGIELNGIKSVGDAYQAMYNSIKKKYWGGADLDNWAKGAGFEQYAKSVLGEDTYNSLIAYGSQAQAAADALAKINSLKNQLSGGIGGYNINVPATESSKSSKSPEDLHKEAFDNWYAQLKWQRDNNIIDETNFLQQLDYKYQNHYADRSKYLEEYAKYSQEVYEGFKKLYQDDLNAQKDSLEKQKDELKELADARKQALEDAKDEEDYKKDQSEKREEINKLKVLIASFRGTLSLSSQKKLRELQQQLKEKEDELNDFEKDKALERAKNQIDKEYESQEKAINEQIKGIEAQLEQINDDLPAIRDAVMSFARQYGVTITRAYASGTSSVPAITQENGAEVIAGNIKRGQFTMLTPTSKVWNASATQALWDFANSPQGYLSSVMDKISSFKQKAMSMIYSQPVNVNVGGITVNGNADNQTVQKIKHSQKEQVEEILKTMKKLQ